MRARSVSAERHEVHRLVVLLWLAIAWIVGTFVFETTAFGAEGISSDSPAPLKIRFFAALDEDETNVSLATTPLPGLYRLERNEKVKSSINKIIETETQQPAQLNSNQAVKPAGDVPSRGSKTGFGADAKPAGIANAQYELVEKVADIVARGLKQVAHTGDYFAPVQIDTSMPSAPTKQDGKQQGDIEPSKAVSILESNDKADPPQPVADPTSEEVHVKTLPFPALAAKPAVDSSQPEHREGSQAKVLRAKPISLITPSATSRDAETETGKIAKPLLPQKDLGELLDVKTDKPEPQTDSTAATAAAETNRAAKRVAVNVKPFTKLATQDSTNSVAENSPQPVAGTAKEAIAAVAVKPVSNNVANPNVSEPTPISEAQSNPVARIAATPVPPIRQPDAVDLPLVNHQLQQPQRPEPIRQPDEAIEPAERIAANWQLNAPPAANNEPAVSLNVDTVDVRTVLEMLARGYGMNILVAPDVNGVVTANVEGLTPDQTLHGVLKMCGLRAQVENDVIFVYSANKLPADARQLRLFPLDFARAQTLEPTVQGLLSPIGNAYSSVLDSQDNLKTSEAIVVVDTPESIKQIESYIYQVDRAPRQVMIEARILEVELSDKLEHGIDFAAILGRDLRVGTDGLTSMVGTGDAVYFASISGRDVDALIELLETTTDAKTLASPKIMVVNGQQAKIQVGQQLGFTVATVTQTSTIQDVQFLDTGVVLNVKPTISRDNKVMMEVKPEVSNGQINPDTLLPEEETRELETSVLLNDHQGMVIGGLIQETDRTVIKKLPWLGDVRHIGKFFQKREATRSRSEIIVALVPHIVEVDDCPHREHPDHEAGKIEYERTATPILQGVLQRTCRPWEPRLPDTVGAEKHYDVNRINRMMP